MYALSRNGGRGAVGELNDIVQRLEPSLGPLRGSATPLEGGITNRNFRATLGDCDYVIRVHGRNTGMLGIDREAELLASEQAARLGIAPQVAAALEDCLVTSYLDSASVSPQEAAVRAQEIARALRRFHAAPVRLPASFWVPDLLEGYARILRRRAGSPPEAFTDAVGIAKRIARAVPLTRAVPCHNDLLAGNILIARDDGRMMIVDWEYAGMGHPCFDLGNLSINNDFDEAADERLLGAYCEGQPSPGARAALRLMRVLSDAREAAWGVVQGAISELDFDFQGYAGKHFERLTAAAARPDFDRWLAAAEW